MSRPTDPSSTGSYIGVETADPLNAGSIQLKTTTIESPGSGQLYAASDILQTSPAEHSLLGSAGIQIGAGTELVTKTAGGKPFTCNYSTTIFYGVNGTLRNNGYLWPGTQAVSTSFPDTSPVYYYIQKPCILVAMSCSLIAGPGIGQTLTLTVRRTPSGGLIANTEFTVTFSDQVNQTNVYNKSLNLGAGDRIHVYLEGTDTNNANDLTVQLNIF
jgi:hypothetical protein